MTYYTIRSLIVPYDEENRAHEAYLEILYDELIKNQETERESDKGKKKFCTPVWKKYGF